MNGAAKVRFEPEVSNAALCANVRSSNGGQKPVKIKPSFVNGLSRSIFQDFG